MIHNAWHKSLMDAFTLICACVYYLQEVRHDFEAEAPTQSALNQQRRMSSGDSSDSSSGWGGSARGVVSDHNKFVNGSDTKFVNAKVNGGGSWGHASSNASGGEPAVELREGGSSRGAYTFSERGQQQQGWDVEGGMS